MTDNRARVAKGVPTGGQFAASARSESDVSLSPVDDSPMSAADFGTAADKSAEIRRTEAGDIVGLPDGSNLETIPDPDEGSVVGDIVEAGTYLRTFPDGTTTVTGFSDLAERGKISDDIAFDAVRRRNAQATALTDAFSDDLPDPWGEDVEEEDLVAEARAEQAAEAAFESETAAGIEPGTSPGGVENRSMRVRTGDDGKRYVDDPNSFWHGTEIIHTYTREQALADGVLKDRLADGTDLNQMAREAGIPASVAFTSAAFNDSVAWREGNNAFQDESGRAWDALWMASRPIRAHAMRNNGSLRVGDRIPFTFIRVPNTPRATQPRKQTLVATFSMDDGKPCFTIAMPDED